MITITTLAVVPRIVYIPPQHHRVVLVNRVVAVHRVAPDEVSEAEEYLYIVAIAQPHHVLAPPFDLRRQIPVALDDLVLLEVNVDRVLPVTTPFKLPDLRVPALYSEADIVTVPKDLAVNYPLPVFPVKLEATSDVFLLPRRNGVEVGYVVSGCPGDRGGVYALVVYSV